MTPRRYSGPYPGAPLVRVYFSVVMTHAACAPAFATPSKRRKQLRRTSRVTPSRLDQLQVTLGTLRLTFRTSASATAGVYAATGSTTDVAFAVAIERRLYKGIHAGWHILPNESQDTWGGRTRTEDAQSVVSVRRKHCYRFLGNSGEHDNANIFAGAGACPAHKVRALI